MILGNDLSAINLLSGWNLPVGYFHVNTHDFVMRIATQRQDPSACHTAAMHGQLAKKLGLQPGDTAESPAAQFFLGFKGLCN